MPAGPPERACLEMDGHDAAQDRSAHGWNSIEKVTWEAPTPPKHRRPGARYTRWALPQVRNCSENVESVQTMVATLPQRRIEARVIASKGRAGALQRTLRHAAAA